MRLTVRALDAQEDVPALLALINAVEAVDQVGEGATAESLAQMLALPEHDPAQDRWVVADPADPTRLIGHALVWKPAANTRADLDVAVLPAQRRQGIGGALLVQALGRARRLGAGAAAIYSDDRQPAGGAFLRAHGFAPVAAYVQMHAPGLPAGDPPPLPPDYSVQTFSEVGDWAVLTRAFQTCFTGQWGHQHLDEAGLRRWFDTPARRHDGVWLAFAAGAPVGLIVAELRADLAAKYGVPTGYVDAPGITPGGPDVPLRGALLGRALAWLRAAAMMGAELESWGDSAAALDLYREYGFQQVRRATSYGLPL